jgi:2-oxoglutarate-Fe(II)-dependent oxygenase superfamily protein
VWDWIKPYQLTRDLLSPEELESLQREILESPHLAPEALNSGQRGTYGYTIIFRRSSILRACREMPALRPYLEKTLDGRCNAFFINPLVISEGQQVAPHADRSLGELTTVPFPVKTSVLYLRVPEDLVGGRLSFYFLRIPVARVSPRENSLVEFPGAMRHSVEKVQTCGVPRVSLVCEQYIVKPNVLESIPEYLLSTEK